MTRMSTMLWPDDDRAWYSASSLKADTQTDKGTQTDMTQKYDSCNDMPLQRCKRIHTTKNHEGCLSMRL
jgi:hypothetical protein